MGGDLLKRRLIFITGKGGVGKTTVALALGLRAAAGGLRTMVADLNGEEVEEERELAPGLHRLSVDPQRAMEEYLNVKVGGTTGQLLGQSRLFAAFAMATPGMRELLSLGKVWELAQTRRRTPGAAPYDLTLVDAPASGHGAALLRTPRTFAEIARVGPIANQARAIAQTLADPEFTGFLAVAIPEEPAVTETLQLHEALQRERLNFDAVVLNAQHPDRFEAPDAAALCSLAERDSAARLALFAHRRALAQRAQAARLAERFGERVIGLPFLYTPQIGLPELERLSRELDL
ncbi:MAG: ArsA family ATPase [Solirubrobacteraceae bacterium]